MSTDDDTTGRQSESLNDGTETAEGNLNRRALILGATAAGAAAAAALVVGAKPAAAATGDPLLVGESNAASIPTSLDVSGGTGLVVTTHTDGAAGLFGIDESLDGAYGVSGTSSTGTGVYGSSDQGYGVKAVSNSTAPLLLVPAPSAGPPISGTHQLGEIYVDAAGVLYRCVVPGVPGTWAPIYSTVPLASPVRVVDTRDGNGGITGPLAANATATSNDLTGASGIPAAAIAVVGTVTMVATGQNLPGAGYMTVFPAGTAVPSTSNVNADTGHAIASGLTVALGGAANAGEISFFASFVCHALLDVAGYII